MCTLNEIYGASKRAQGLFKAKYYGTDPNNGDWTSIGKELVSARVTSLVFNDNKIYAGTDSGVYKQFYDSTLWEDFGNNPPDGITSLVYTPDYLIAGCSDKLPVPSPGESWDTVNQGVWSIPWGGDTWTTFGDGLENENIRVLAANDEYIFAGTYSGIYRIHISGGTWEEWGSIDQPNSICIVGDKVYVAQDDGYVKYKPLSGGEWQELGTLDLVSALSDAYTIVSDGEYIYVSFRWGISASDITYRVKRYPISGGDWEDYGTELPTDEPIYALYIYEDWIFAGTESTLYVASLEDGVFEPYNTGLPARARILTIKPGINKLYIGTNGKGVWATE